MGGVDFQDVDAQPEGLETALDLVPRNFDQKTMKILSTSLNVKFVAPRNVTVKSPHTQFSEP